MRAAYRLAAVARRDDLRAALPQFTNGSLTLLRAVVAQYDGDVDGSVRLLRALLRNVNGDDKAAVADVLAPILIMRNALDQVEALSNAIEEGGWKASALAFRSLVAAKRGERTAAREFAGRAKAMIDHEADEIVRFRVVQRLALSAYYSQDHGEALDLAVASIALCERHGAWRAAAAGYSVAYSIHHHAIGDLEEADRFARLCREAARRSQDESFHQNAIVAEYGLAAQFGDDDRIASLDSDLKRKLLPAQYAERFAFGFAHALVRGATDLVGMRTLLQILQSTSDRTRGESALCSALIAAASAGLREDDEARDYARRAISELGRPRKSDPAFETSYRRLARLAVAAACVMLGDDVRADRVVDVKEAHGVDHLSKIPLYVRTNRWDVLPRSLKGFARVLELAVVSRKSGGAPANLTAAEFEVLRLLAQGWSAVRIAADTGRSVHTVYNHTRAILDKLDASRASEAVAIARSRGYLT